MKIILELFFVTFTSLVFAGLSECSNPGVKAMVTLKGINYANTQAVAALSKAISTMKIPDVSGKADHVEYSVSNIHITDFHQPTSQMSLIPDGSLQWAVNNAGISLTADFHYKYRKGWIKISDHGSLTASLNGASITIAISIGSTSDGHPTMSAKVCSDSIGSVHIKFHGGAAWIYNLFAGTVERKVKDNLQEQLCTLASSAVNKDGERQLQNLPLTVNFAKNFLLDYRLITTPVFTPQYLETYHKGEIYWNGDKREYPVPPDVMPQSGSTDHMLYLWISDYMANSMSYAAAAHNYLAYNLTAEDLPPEDRGILNTSCQLTCIGKLIPKIGQMFPNSVVMLVIYATKPPQLKMTPGFILLNSVGNVDMYAVQSKANVSFLLTINVTLQLNVSASIDDDLLKGKVESAQMQVGLVKSAVGDVPITALNFLLKAALNGAVIPKINEAGEKGLVLPITGNIHLTNSELTVLASSLLIATDVVYQPSDVSVESADSHPLFFQSREAVKGKTAS